MPDNIRVWIEWAGVYTYALRLRRMGGVYFYVGLIRGEEGDFGTWKNMRGGHILAARNIAMER